LLPLLLIDRQAKGGLRRKKAGFDFHSLLFHVNGAGAVREVGAEGKMIFKIGLSATLASDKAIWLHFEGKGQGCALSLRGRKLAFLQRATAAAHVRGLTTVAAAAPHETPFLLFGRAASRARSPAAARSCNLTQAIPSSFPLSVTTNTITTTSPLT